MLTTLSLVSLEEGGMTAAAMKADSVLNFQKLGRKNFTDERH